MWLTDIGTGARFKALTRGEGYGKSSLQEITSRGFRYLVLRLVSMSHSAFPFPLRTSPRLDPPTCIIMTGTLVGHLRRMADTVWPQLRTPPAPALTWLYRDQTARLYGQREHNPRNKVRACAGCCTRGLGQASASASAMNSWSRVAGPNHLRGQTWWCGQQR